MKSPHASHWKVMLQYTCAIVLLFFSSAFCDISLNILYVMQFRKAFIFVRASRYRESSTQDKKSLLLILGDLKCQSHFLVKMMRVELLRGHWARKCQWKGRKQQRWSGLTVTPVHRQLQQFLLSSTFPTPTETGLWQLCLNYIPIEKYIFIK